MIDPYLETGALLLGFRFDQFVGLQHIQRGILLNKASIRNLIHHVGFEIVGKDSSTL